MKLNNKIKENANFHVSLCCGGNFEYKTCKDIDEVLKYVKLSEITKAVRFIFECCSFN